MIPSNELRIGNLVLDNGVKRKVTGIVTSDISHHVFLDDSVTYRSLKNVEPIVLTTELLEKFGFELSRMPFTGDIGYSKSEQGKFFIGLLEWGNNGFLFHNPHFDLTIKYVHQIQNLYFVNTREELPINF